MNNYLKKIVPLLLINFLLVSCSKEEEIAIPVEDNEVESIQEIDEDNQGEGKSDLDTPLEEKKDLEVNTNKDDGAIQESDDTKKPAIEELSDKQDTTKEEKEETPEESKTRGMSVEPDDVTMGDPKAPVVFLEYFSPTCPSCAYFHKNTFPKIKEKYVDTGKILYVKREFIANKQDLDATILARCGGSLDSYEKFLNVILSQQSNWAFNKNYREILTNIGSLGGIAPEKYAACLNDENMIAVLVENTKFIVKQPYFVGTPSFFIDEKQFTDPYTFEAISESIDKALKQNELKKTQSDSEEN